MKIPKQMIKDLQKQNIFINSKGKQRFNSGRILSDEQIYRLIADYKKSSEECKQTSSEK